jgi:type I restriction enzyme, S subunit
MKQLPDNWHWSLLGDLANVWYGKARPKDDEGPYPVIGSGGVYSYSTRPLINYETIVIGRKGSAGTAYYCADPCYPADTTFFLEWKQPVHVPFVYAWLQFRNLAPDHSVIPSLQRGDVESFPIPLPPLEEQKAITAVLRTVQEAIAARRREAALERERKAALMQRLFTYGTRGERLKDTAVGRVPESWEVKPLKACAFGPYAS